MKNVFIKAIRSRRYFHLRDSVLIIMCSATASCWRACAATETCDGMDLRRAKQKTTSCPHHKHPIFLEAKQSNSLSDRRRSISAQPSLNLCGTSSPCPRVSIHCKISPRVMSILRSLLLYRSSMFVWPAYCTLSTFISFYILHAFTLRSAFPSRHVQHLSSIYDSW